MDEFEEHFQHRPEESDDEPELTPTWRATIRRGRLMLTGWAPWLITGGPLGTLLPARARAGVTIADLTVHGADNDELSVRYLVRAEPDGAGQEVLLDWAPEVGYSRVWLPDCIMVELDPDPRATHPRQRALRRLPRALVRRDAGVLARRSRGEGVSEVVPDVRLRDGAVGERARPTPEAARRPAEAARWAASGSRPRQRQEKT